jgi:hypothetical protein
VAAAVVLAVLAGGAAIAGAVVPPAGTPDLAAMALRPSDLAPGAVGKGSYIKPAAAAIAEWEVRFGAVETTAGAHLTAVANAIVLVHSAAFADKEIKAVAKEFDSKAVRRLIVASLASQAGVKGAASGHLTLGKIRSIGVGQESLLVPLVLRAAGRTTTTDLTFVAQGAVVSDLVIAAKGRLAASVPIDLLTAVAAHIAAVFAGVGSTGPSGPTGATGATGTTGACPVPLSRIVQGSTASIRRCV